MSQATLSEGYHNSNLFSNYYLDERIYGLDAWDCDEEAREAYEELQGLYETEGGALSSYKEDQLLSSWLDKVLGVLGYQTLPESTLPSGGGYVDRLLFDSGEDRRDAANLASDGMRSAAFKKGIGVLEAKQWGSDFESTFSEDRQYRNASHQIKFYLESTPENINWGILTDGKKWRLYGTKDYETNTYYEVDLPELLLKDDLEAFKRFYVFFRSEAFREVSGTTFLDQVWSESETAAQELGEDLQDNVFTALRVLGEGFVESNDLDIDPDDDAAMEELKEQSLVLLYRLMFLLYAEGRGLIHPEGPHAKQEYQENFSLKQIRKEIYDEAAETAGFDAEYSEYSTTLRSKLQNLFDLVDTGNDDLGIPPYNGGLFDDERHSFLAEHEVSDRHLAEVIYRISTTESEQNGGDVLADYADLDTRHLGSIYEGLLEHRFRIAPEDMAAVAEDGTQEWKPATEVSVADAVETVHEGELYVINDDGERKATGAYYTPDYVVTYIVEETVDPLLEDIREDLESEGFERGTARFVSEFAPRVQDLKILDPAMGSGHFLTKATGYLTEQIMAEAREAEVGTLFDEQHIKREIAKECIYGVDLNEMATELAKLSMWLETLAADQPLAFLDHHLKTGNSLVGSDIEEIEELESDLNGDKDQSSLAEFGATRQGTIERLMDVYQEFLAIENEDLAGVKAMERKYREIEQDELRQRLVAMANVRTAEDFGGGGVPPGAYERMAEALENDEEWAGVSEEDWFRTAQKNSGKNDFFHWKLEFPEVFYEQDGSKGEKNGFDSIIGNPPYVRIYRDRLPESLVEYFRTTFESAYKKFDLYVLFLDQGLELTRKGGMTSQIVPDKFLNTPYGEKIRNKIFDAVNIHSILDLREVRVFEEASVSNVVPVFAKEAESNDSVAIRKKKGARIVEVNRPSVNLLTTGTDNSIRLRLQENDIAILNKVRENSIRFDDIYYVNWGLRTGTADKTDKYVVEETDDSRAKPMIRGQDIADRYRLLPPSEYIVYNPADFYNPMFPELFENPKIVFRKISGEGIMAVADESGLYCFSTLIPCVNIRYISHVSRSGIPEETPESAEYDDMYFALAIVNSSLSAWYYHKMLSDELSVVPGHVSELPIPEIDFSESSTEEETLETLETRTSNGDTLDITGLRTLLEIEQIRPNETIYRVLSICAEQLSGFQRNRVEINCDLPDHLGNYFDGPTLADLSPMPPSGIADSILTETTETRDSLRVGSVEVERDGSEVTIHLSARYKPEDKDDYETDRWGYIETTLEPVMRFTGLDEEQATLIEAFVPHAVEEAGGFAGFRETATKTNSLIDRLETLTLPRLKDVAAGLQRYHEATERAAELDEKIERIDGLIDEIVYELYGLTDEEIEIVEEAVGE